MTCRFHNTTNIRVIRGMLVLFTLMVSGGCLRPHAPTAAERDRGLIWLFPGVEGSARTMSLVYDAIRDSGVESAIEIHNWQTPFGTFVNLMSHERNRRDAARVASQIEAYARAHPGRQIDLVGYSGGGGMALMTAEALSEDIKVRNVVLVHPAISREYDLSQVLSRVDGKIVHFHSPYDWLILGLGTSAFGTMDRVRTVSAGKDGFEVQKAIPILTDRGKLHEQPWNLAMARYGHWGGHGTILIYAWNRQYVAPWLKDASTESATTAARTSTLAAPEP